MAFTRRDRLIGIGEFLRWWMQQHDYSFAQVAAKLECSKGWPSAVAQGTYLFPQGFITALKPHLTKEESEVMLEALFKDIRGWYEAD